MKCQSEGDECINCGDCRHVTVIETKTFSVDDAGFKVIEINPEMMLHNMKNTNRVYEK